MQLPQDRKSGCLSTPIPQHWWQAFRKEPAREDGPKESRDMTSPLEPSEKPTMPHSRLYTAAGVFVEQTAVGDGGLIARPLPARSSKLSL